jgi:L-aminopeptidase/D-esterase-like protein
MAGGRLADGTPVCAQDVLCSGAEVGAPMGWKPRIGGVTGGNTTIGVVATDAKLSKEQAARLATVAHDGYVRCIRPAHTQLDGDTVFSVATGRSEDEASFVALCAVAAEVMARAVANAILAASKA